MHDPELIWRLGRWIAQRGNGELLLGWTDGQLEMRVRRGQIVSMTGPDPVQLARALDREPAGHRDLLQEARVIAGRTGIPETEAVAAAKEVLLGCLASWLADAGRRLEIDAEEPAELHGPTISISHALVELILSNADDILASRVLPEPDVLLRRAPDFLELYSPLRLSEEADLVVAKITGQRTATEIAGRSPQGAAEVMRLLAALVATGMLEPDRAAVSEPPPVLADRETADDARRRQLPIRWIALGAVVLVAALLTLALTVLRTGGAELEATTGTWGLVVDIGCEPEELQRVLKKARQNPNQLRPLQADAGGDAPCWQLVWGTFSSREAAEMEVSSIPGKLLLPGFEPHAIRLPDAPPSEDRN